MKTIGLHDDYESQGIKRSDESDNDSDGNPRRHRSSSSDSDRSKDKDAGSDASGGSQRRKFKKLNKRGNKKVRTLQLTIPPLIQLRFLAQCCWSISWFQ